MEHRFELRKSGNELAPLLILATTSFLIVGGTVFAAQTTETAAAITRMGQANLGSLAFGLMAMAVLVLSRGRPREVMASAGEHTLYIDGKRRLGARSIRHAYVIRDGDRWSVEIEQLFGALRLLTDDQEAAERLAGRLRGVDRVPTAVYRLRKKAHYLLFTSTIFAWSAVFAGVFAMAVNWMLGLILVAITLPVALWVTLRTIPVVVLVERSGVFLLHPRSVRSIPVETIKTARVVNDDAVRIFVEGEQITLSELAHHPRDRDARTSEPPAERLESSLLQIVPAAA